MQTYKFIAIAFVCAMTACSQPGEGPAIGGPGAGEPVVTPGGPVEFGIGDVQFHLDPKLTVSQRSLGPAVDERRFQSQFEHLTRVEANLANIPEELWLDLTFSGAEPWPGYAVVVNATVFADQQPLEENIQFVLTPETARQPRVFTFNLLESLQAVPASVLVHAEANYILVKTDDPASVTPESVTSADGESAEKVSNPLRVNFPVQETTPSISSL